jgi:hypothetical protein
MKERKMSENEDQTPEHSSGEDLVEELRLLGMNLKNLLKHTWESEERKKFKEEMQAGLADLGTTLSKAANDFAASPTGQTMKADLEDLNERIRSGEVEAKVRQEVLSALRTANAGLKKAAAKSTPPGTTEESQ